MKKIICTLISLILIFTTLTSQAAADEQPKTEVISNADGYTIVITTRKESLSTDSNTRVLITNDSKDFTCYQNGVALWKVTLSGTFQYNGVFATCIGSGCTTTVYASGWSCSSKSSSESGNVAIADATMVKKVLGVVTETRYVHLTLTCDPNGNVS